MKKAIITGASGFVGAQLVQALSAREYAVCAVFSPTSKVSFPSMPCISVVRCDMSRYCDLPHIAKDFRNADVFFHLAWNGSAGSARADSELQLDNVRNTCDAVSAAKELGCKRFVGAGSIMEDECLAAAFENNGTLMPSAHYSVSKLTAHIMAQIEARRLGIPFCWGKISNAYGETDYTGRFIRTLLAKLIRNEECRLTSCKQLYDFIYVAELARAFVEIGERGIPGRTYYIGSGEAQPLRNFIEVAYALAASDSELLFGAVPFEGTMQSAACFDTTPLFQDTGFVCQTPFSVGIANTISSMRQEMNVKEKPDHAAF